MTTIPDYLANLPKRYDAGQLLIQLWERDNEGEPACYFDPFTIEPCDHSHWTVCHLIPQSWLRREYGRGAIWVPHAGRFRPANRLEKPDLTLEQIRSDLRNMVAGRWSHHQHFDHPEDSRHFKVPRERLPVGFERFVFEFRAEPVATRRFGGIAEVAA